MVERPPNRMASWRWPFPLLAHDKVCCTSVPPRGLESISVGTVDINTTGSGVIVTRQPAPKAQSNCLDYHGEIMTVVRFRNNCHNRVVQT